MDFVLIDGSYFIFYRYHALRIWWGLAKKEEETDNYCENQRFLDKFRETFVSKIKEINKNLNIEKSIIFVGKDCPRKEIWRNSHIDDYKSTRNNSDSNIKTLFEIAYNEKLFEMAGAKLILSSPKLEADDCVAITAKYIIEHHPNSKVWIITSDMDYLQLACDDIKLYDLKFKNLTDSKQSFKNNKKDLFCKIVSGDKSDNIPGVFPKCGIKTAEKYFNNNILFETKLNHVDGAQERYERNKLIIDFDNIPEELTNHFIETNMKK
tara:strand:+ start:109 stop:903 length:795 start_codon:yes stop_codon:yes gene_type:complete